MFTLDKSSLILDALSENIIFDPLVKRYRYKGSNKPGEPITGSFVSRDAVINLQRSYLEKITQEFKSLSPRIIAGEIGVYQDAAKLLKNIHLSNAIIAANGIDKLSNADLGKIGSILKKQYYAGVDEKTGKRYGLKHLFKEVQDGIVTEDRLKQRLDLYALSGDISGSIVKTNKRKELGFNEEQRLLGDAKHCPSCIRYAALGWVPIGTLPEPKTMCECRSNCKCSKEYRNSYEIEVT